MIKDETNKNMSIKKEKKNKQTWENLLNLS
jgi:hypothetical protein